MRLRVAPIKGDKENKIMQVKGSIVGVAIMEGGYMSYFGMLILGKAAQFRKCDGIYIIIARDYM